MRTPLALALSAGICVVIAPLTASAQTGCRPTVTEEGGYSVSRTYADKVKSLFAWRKATSEKHGTNFQNWRTAADRKIECDQRWITGVGRRWVCTRSARPCAAGNAAIGNPAGPVDPVEIYGRATLRRGSSGEYVKNLQRTLQDLNYDVTIDGRFGRATERAVRKFQADRRLVIDGRVGPATKQQLIS